MKVRGVVTALVAGLMLAFSACGEESGSGTITLNFWAYNEPGGTFREAAQNCTAESGGRYRINFNALGNDPNTQRQQLVRRLAAGDSSIDIMSMDVIWTAEFAEAGWILPFPEDVAEEMRQGTLKGPMDTATYEDKVFGAPANSNTQLLWYRKDLVDEPPTTWSEMIDMATNMEEAGRIETMGDAYEGLTVWVNSLIQSAGGEILSSPDEVSLEDEPAKAPIGGFNWGVGGYTEHPEEAFDAAACMRDERNQRAFAIDGGLPPTLESLYDDPKFQEQYPFGDVIRRQLDDAGVRPPTPSYADVSLAISTTIAPPTELDVDAAYDELRQKVADALASKGLL